jgi:glutamine synthetase
MKDAAEAFVAFGSMVFSDAVMMQRLPTDAYTALRACATQGTPLPPNAADAIASAMKTWAMEKGVTRFTHWFQPMTGGTAEKHDSFLSRTANTAHGQVIMELTGASLIQGEPDASSFPSGGLRATSRARGYTVWDPTSHAFIKDGVLCIPAALFSHTGEALDKKTPLLRSMDALNRQALRILRLFGNADATAVRATVGPEQEYFLIDRAVFERRKDLIYTGRTLFGARPPKTQELDDHYLGALKPRVAAFMKDLSEELWKLGVLAKTAHNEVAPAQHELAPAFTIANIAADHNQLTMEIMRTTAAKHGMVCLLHEKPFACVNGSGKHNNWSLATETGENLLEPGYTPAANAQFLTFLCAVIKAVNEYQDLLRVSVASAGNDHRLGANEAPPAILSVYLGDELTAVLDAIDRNTAPAAAAREPFNTGVPALPRFLKFPTDRNRTSPFAFTGNKFEFRMPGSAASISEANTVLNTIVAEELRQFADRLECAADFESELRALLRDVIRSNKRILFNGDGYSPSWAREAATRGLLNLRTTPDAAPHLLADKNIRLFAAHNVLSETELRARHEIMLETYCRTVRIEALTMLDMIMKDILPAVSSFSARLSQNAAAKAAVCSDSDCSYETAVLTQLSRLTGEVFRNAAALNRAVTHSGELSSTEDAAAHARDTILPLMTALRTSVDEMETMTPSDCWPYPSCGQLLFSVR